MKRYSVFAWVLAVVAISLFLAGVSIAGPDSVYKKIHEQQDMIRHAVHNGTLSRSDAAVLKRNLHKIEEKLERYINEDRLTHEHEKKLKKRLKDNMELFHSMTNRQQPRRFD